MQAEHRVTLAWVKILRTQRTFGIPVKSESKFLFFLFWLETRHIGDTSLNFLTEVKQPWVKIVILMQAT